MNNPLSPYFNAIIVANAQGTLPSLQVLVDIIDRHNPLLGPVFHQFCVPEGHNFDSLKDLVKKSFNCRKYLTDENFGTPFSSAAIKGGFLNMGKLYNLEEVIEVVKVFAEKTGLKIRLGTPIELIAYIIREGLPYPEKAICLSKFLNKRALSWIGNLFSLYETKNGIDPNYEVFIVCDLD